MAKEDAATDVDEIDRLGAVRWRLLGVALNKEAERKDKGKKGFGGGQKFSLKIMCRDVIHLLMPVNRGRLGIPKLT